MICSSLTFTHFLPIFLSLSLHVRLPSLFPLLSLKISSYSFLFPLFPSLSLHFSSLSLYFFLIFFSLSQYFILMFLLLSPRIPLTFPHSFPPHFPLIFPHSLSPYCQLTFTIHSALHVIIITQTVEVKMNYKNHKQHFPNIHVTFIALSPPPHFHLMKPSLFLSSSRHFISRPPPSLSSHPQPPFPPFLPHLHSYSACSLKALSVNLLTFASLSGLQERDHVWVWVYKVVMVVWFIFGLGYIYMVITFVMKRLKSNEVSCKLESVIVY